MEDDPVAGILRQHVAMRVLVGVDMPLARLLLKMGKPSAGTVFTGRRQAAKQCFRNALKLAEKTGMRYAEGYGLSGTLLERGLAFPVEHAWCVDGSGRAVDPTWEKPEASFYLGIEFDASSVWKRVAETGTFGMFSRGPAGAHDLEFMERLMPGLEPGKVQREWLETAFAPAP